jgi:quinol monooxygenase YgiN
MYAVTVRLEVPPEEFEKLLELLRVNAAASLAEPGCRRFDVCVDAQSHPVIFLYELYDDEASFSQHLASAHFKAFASATSPLNLRQEIRYYHLLPIR